MAEQDKRVVMPRLRFPQFQRGWDDRRFVDFLTESRIPGSDGSVARKLTVKLWGNGVVEKSEAFKGSVNTQYYRRKAGQLIYSKLDFLNQAFGIVPDHLDGYESTVDLPCFDVDECIHPRYLLEYVQRKDFYERFGEIADGGRKAKRIQVETFLSFPIAVPEDFEEQQKIADCLTSLDEVIAAQGREVEALKTYKRGLMQQLFPREGETLPRLRLPEFRSAPEWTSKPLGDLFAHIRNGFVGTATPHYVGSGIPYLQGKNVRDGRIDPKDLVMVSEVFHEKQQKSQLQSNDILMVQSGHVGECAVVGERYAGSNCHALIVMTPREHQQSTYFVQYFYSIAGRKKIQDITTGNTVKHILATDLKALVVSAPEPDEQRRVGECLSVLDGRITSELEKLHALKVHKKGLMQQLFPSSEEG